MMIALMTICKPEIVHPISFIPKLNDVDDDVNAAVIHKINISTSSEFQSQGIFTFQKEE